VVGNAKDILVAITGGTIDAMYDPAHGVPYHVPLNGSSVVPEAIAALGYGDLCECWEVCNKDSKDISESEMATIIDTALAKGFSKLLVVMGTDGLATHAAYAQSYIEKLGAKARHVQLVFTGALIPLRRAPDSVDGSHWNPASDGMAHLRYAIAQLLTHVSVVVTTKHAPGPERLLPGHVQKRVEIAPDGKTVLQSAFVRVD
jgi:L-asparaginase/Glu-tRNA(Gln) amidotransferase subunit D